MTTTDVDNEDVGVPRRATDPIFYLVQGAKTEAKLQREVEKLKAENAELRRMLQ